MTATRFELASRYAHQRLAAELSPFLYYHSLHHTFNDVLPAARKLALHSRLELQARNLLLTGVLFHDLGWVVVQGNTAQAYARGREHEVQSVEFARLALPGFGYTPAEIDLIGGLIMATHVPQQPHTQLEQIIVDADMSSIGRQDFWFTSMALREELAAFGNFIPEIDWYQRQFHLLTSFTFFSKVGRDLYDSQRRANASAIKSRLEQLGISVA